MIISVWSLALFSLFNVQFSHDKTNRSEYFTVSNGTLTTCIYPGDRPFKKGSKTFPRAELRYLDEQIDGVYNLTVDLLSVTAPPGMDYSVYQLFGNGPLVMARKRFGKNQVVVFDGEPKFSPVEQFPKWCVIKCGPSGYVTCPGVQSFGDIDCGDSLHFKIGIYAQQMDPIGRTCSSYGPVSFNAVTDVNTKC